MKQLNFMDEIGAGRELSTDIFDYYPAVFTPLESEMYLKKFINETPWNQKSVLMYGKEVLTPRLTAWFGNPDVDYSIKGTGATPISWTPELLEIKSKIEEISGISFNSVLLNYYRDGNDSVSWHTDNDGIEGRNKFVGSVSFGQERDFDIRSKNDHAKKFSILLEDGSYLLMKGNFQEHFQHRIAKSKTVMKERVNLTFRIM